MAFVTESSRVNFWFGTEQRMSWIPTPLSGAEVSPSGWGADGTLLNGGGFALNSFGSHKRYIFEWPASSSREVAQLMKSYSDGTYGRGLLYFIDPLVYDQNVFPAMWADPSIGLRQEGAALVYGGEPESLPTSGWEENNLPIASAYYDLASVAAGWRGKEDAVFIPIPDGYDLHLGSIHSVSGNGRVFYRTQSSGGGLGTEQVLSPVAADAGSLTNTVLPASNAGVWVWIGKSASGAGSVTLTAMTARLHKASKPVLPSFTAGPWVGGQGHSGCRFLGKPTLINNSGVNGGQVGFAATFVEVGSWLYG